MSNYHGNGQNAQYYGAPGAPQPSYNDNESTYQPPRDDGYRHDMAVERYDDERSQYHDRRDRDRYEDDNYYDDRRSGYDDRNDRSRSRSRRRSSSGRGREIEGERGSFSSEGRKDHHREKEIGATVVGGAVGAFAGHELGHGGLATTIGTIAGAFAGHELEKRHEKKKDKRRQSEEAASYESYGRRSISGSRGYERDDYSDRGSDYDESRRRHHHQGRDSDRYD